MFHRRTEIEVTGSEFLPRVDNQQLRKIQRNIADHYDFGIRKEREPLVRDKLGSWL